MKYLELINKCLLELNYRQVTSLAELVKIDHKKIIQNINIVNNEICNIESWEFLLRDKTITLEANSNQIENNIGGRIKKIIIDDKQYCYSDNVESFILNKYKPYTYTVFKNKILLPEFNENKEVLISYYSENSVIDEYGNEKKIFETNEDKSLIPMPFGEQLLVYGTCLRLKSNPEYIKFSYWMSMYKEALKNLKSTSCADSKNAPNIRLHRE